MFLRLGYNAIFIVIIIAVFAFSNYFDSTNYSSISTSVVETDKSTTDEIEYIKNIKSNIEEWESKNKPSILRDAFNKDRKDKIEAPIKGGSINVYAPVEPKTLIPWLDNSSYTALIASYIFNSLLTENPETFEKIPSLAKSYKMEDVVWLKGRSRSPKFGTAKKDDNYIIGSIDRVDYDGDKAIKRIVLNVDGKSKVIDSKELRYKQDKADKSYIRAFDKQVVFTFYLQKGVKWHDGRQFSADDVIFSLNTIKNPYIPELSHLRLYYAGLKHWEKIDKYTVRLYFDTKYFQLLDLASGFLILPKHIYLAPSSKYTEKEFARHFVEHPANRTPVGTSAYYFPSSILKKKSKEKGWALKEYVNLVRNDDYFGRKAYLRNIYFRFIPNRDTAFIELKNNRIDFMSSMTSEQFFKSSVSSEFKAKFVKAFYYTGGFSYIGYNMKKVYFRDKRVRKAITLLLDRKRILKNFLYGLGKIVSGSQYYFGPAYNHSVIPYDYNREEAIRLLNEASWFDSDGDGIRDKDGIPFTIELLYPQGSSSASSINPMLYEELNSVGISLKLTRLEWASFLQHLRDRRFDMCILGWGTSIESDPYQVWHSSQWANKGSNHVGFDNKEVDKLIEKARRTLPSKDRHEMYFRFHEILHEEQPYLFLFTSPSKAVYNKRYRNVKFYRVRPGFDLSQWFIPLNLQTNEERERERE